MTSNFFKQFLNLRAYSSIDLVFTGLLAKFSIFHELSFSIKELWLALSLVFLWFFYNLLLENYKKRVYRTRPNIIFPILFIIASIIISVFINPITLIPLLISTILVFLYLFKKKIKILGNLSWFIRALIQACYFIYALLFYTTAFSEISVILTIFVFLGMSVRSLIGDLRDEKTDREENKRTFVVIFGKTISVIVINTFLAILIVLGSCYFSFLTTIPLLLLGLSLIIFRNHKNNYYSHQLTVMTTMFFSINLIFYFLRFDLWLINLGYLGIFFNMIFYPLLERKSNPKFE